MSGDCALPNDQLCGCCDGVTQETPQLITNRPALPEISYRVGTHATFNASMLASLSDPAYPALAMLRTRDTSDFSIALLDSWAVALDILTFYQERFANEPLWCSDYSSSMLVGWSRRRIPQSPS